jgi:hypothetical protein
MPTITFIYEDEEEDREVELPAIWMVCPRCHGEGKHVDPRIDGNGFTEDDWAQESHEFKEDYMSGKYDVTCHECKGLRVVPEVDEHCCDPELLKAYYEKLDADADYERTCRMELMYGC